MCGVSESSDRRIHARDESAGGKSPTWWRCGKRSVRRVLKSCVKCECAECAIAGDSRVLHRLDSEHPDRYFLDAWHWPKAVANSTLCRYTQLCLAHRRSVPPRHACRVLYDSAFCFHLHKHVHHVSLRRCRVRKERWTISSNGYRLLNVGCYLVLCPGTQCHSLGIRYPRFHSFTKRFMIVCAGRQSEIPAFSTAPSSASASVALSLLPNTIARAVPEQVAVVEHLDRGQCALAGCTRRDSGGALLTRPVHHKSNPPNKSPFRCSRRNKVQNSHGLSKIPE